jgi:hypothetical protein
MARAICSSAPGSYARWDFLRPLRDLPMFPYAVTKKAIAT